MARTRRASSTRRPARRRRRPATGTIGWIDLTVADAARVRDFYAEVAGWTPVEVPMGGYADFAMVPPGLRKPVAGVCHARGANAELPPAWLIYIRVDDLARSLRRCRSRGGEVISGPRGMGAFGRYAVICDPAGAVAGLIEPPR
jgi:predicted enzyme related to lactoylglutathione lyase